MMDLSSTVRSVVLLSPIFLTVPVVSLIVIISPILKGLDPIIENELKKSSINFWEAKATAIPHTPRDARSGVIATPTVSKKINAANIQIRIWRSVLRISVRFFLVFVSWWAKPFSITTFGKNFRIPLSSITNATTKKPEKTTWIHFTNGRKRFPQKSATETPEYHDSPDKITKKSFLREAHFPNLASKNLAPNLIKQKSTNNQITTPHAKRKSCIDGTVASSRKNETSISSIHKNKTLPL